MKLVDGHESFLALSNRGALSILDASFKFARARGQPADKKEDSETCDENLPSPVPKSARAVPGRRPHRLRVLVYHQVCRDGKLEDSLPEAKSCEGTRSAMESSNRSWQVPQVCKKARAPSGRRHQSPSYVSERLLCPGSAASPWFPASDCRDGSLAVVQPSKLPRNLPHVAVVSLAFCE